MEIDNAYSPLGILYIHQFQYSGGSDGLNLPTTVSEKHDSISCPPEREITIYYFYM
jgi:hypothetical protein